MWGPRICQQAQSGTREYRKGPSDRTLTGLALAAGLTPLSLSTGLREDMLETLVPKVQGKRVMVVLGPWAGRVSPRPGNGRRSTQGMSLSLSWPC